MLPWQDKSKLQALVCKHHSVFALEDGERGETGMVQMEINTGIQNPKDNQPDGPHLQQGKRLHVNYVLCKTRE